MLIPEAFNGSQTSMRRAVIDNPEYAAGLIVGRACHDLVDQAIERVDASAALTAAEDSGSMYIQCRHISPGATSGVFMLDLHGQMRFRRQGEVSAAARLNTGFFVGGDDEFVVMERPLFPDALIKIEDTAGLGRKFRIARENPTAVLPGPDRIGVKPTPHRAVTDCGHKSGLAHLGAQIGDTPTRQWHVVSGRQFTGQGFYLNDQFWGEKPGDDPAGTAHQDRRVAPRKNVCATC